MLTDPPSQCCGVDILEQTLLWDRTRSAQPLEGGGRGVTTICWRFSSCTGGIQEQRDSDLRFGDRHSVDHSRPMGWRCGLHDPPHQELQPT